MREFQPHHHSNTHDPQDNHGSIPFLSTHSSDSDYCKDIARKSVARAALHLGIENMSTDALDVMGDVLISYLEKFGRVIAAKVEASCRSSAHCNVLDAIHAVEVCTSPAVYQTQLSHNGDNTLEGDPMVKNGFEAISKPVIQDIMGWEGLASFLFGHDWMNIPLPGDEDGANIGQDDSGEERIYAASPRIGLNDTIYGKVGDKVRSGKQLPQNEQLMNHDQKKISFNIDNTDVGSNLRTISQKVEGWNAPYLEAIPSFPVSYSLIANPHRLPHSIGSSFHHPLATEEEACQGESIIVGRGHRHGKSIASKYHTSTASTNVDSSNEFDKDVIDQNQSVQQSLVDKVQKELDLELADIPDDFYYDDGVQSFWGSFGSLFGSKENKGENQANSVKKTAAMEAQVDIVGTSKQGMDSTETNKKENGLTLDAHERARKRVRIEDNRDAYVDNIDGGMTSVQFERHRPGYVPSFFPEFPPKHTYLQQSTALYSPRSNATKSYKESVQKSRKYTEEGDMPSTSHSTELSRTVSYQYGESSAQAVRRSLVNLEQSVGNMYWGSLGSDREEKRNMPGEISIMNDPSVLQLRVPSGLPTTNQLASPKASATGVVSLGRASGARVSRILEGSMDAYQ